MSYQTIKDGLTLRLNGLGYQESEYGSLESVPSEEFGMTFILNPLSGENDEETSETISSLIYDIQKWEILFLFQKTNTNQNIILDDMNRRKDALIKDLDNPANWASYARIQKYKAWSIEDRPSSMLLRIELKIIDTITY